MRKFWAALAILFVLSPLGAASADTMSISQVIHITGVVPPIRNIVVDGQGNIIEITSNTLENVTPQVRRGSLSYGPEVPLTPALLKDYEAKIKGKDLYSTDLRFALPNPVAAKAKKPVILSALEQMSWLHLPRL